MSEVLSPQEQLIVDMDGDADLTQLIERVDELSPHVGLFRLGIKFALALLGELSQKDEDLVAFRKKQAREFFSKLDGRIMLDVGSLPGAFLPIPRSLSSAPPRIITVHSAVEWEELREVVKGAGTSEVFVDATPAPSDDYVVSSEDIHRARTCTIHAAGIRARGIVCASGVIGLIRGVRPSLDSVLFDALADARFICSDALPEWSGNDGGVMTPAQAVQAGFDRVVIGSPITRSPKGRFASRAAAAQAIVEEIASVSRRT